MARKPLNCFRVPTSAADGQRFKRWRVSLHKIPGRADQRHDRRKIDTMTDEAKIEAEIQSKGLNAPRLNPQMIDEAITSEQYHVFKGTTMTVCALTLRNGYIVTGESAAASPENFDEAIGRKIARDNARNKIWALEDYLLREKLFTA